MSDEVDFSPEQIREIIPELRVWEYDGDGTKIYKLDQGYDKKTPYTKKHYYSIHFWKGRF